MSTQIKYIDDADSFTLEVEPERTEDGATRITAGDPNADEYISVDLDDYTLAAFVKELRGRLSVPAAPVGALAQAIPTTPGSVILEHTPVARRTLTLFGDGTWLDHEGDERHPQHFINTHWSLLHDAGQETA